MMCHVTRVRQITLRDFCWSYNNNNNNNNNNKL